MAPVLDLCRQLCGLFCNQQQAFDNPPLYAHIQVRMRPLVHFAPGSLLLEQAYTIAPDQPYRLRVLQLIDENGQLRIRNQAVTDESRWFGSGADPERMATLTADALQFLEGCTYDVNPKGSGFIGTIEEGCRCRVVRKGRDSYLVSHFEIEGDRMETLDRGHDPETHELVWGSLAGPFAFRRLVSYADEIPEAWLDHWA